MTSALKTNNRGFIEIAIAIAALAAIIVLATFFYFRQNDKITSTTETINNEEILKNIPAEIIFATTGESCRKPPSDDCYEYDTTIAAIDSEFKDTYLQLVENIKDKDWSLDVDDEFSKLTEDPTAEYEQFLRLASGQDELAIEPELAAASISIQALDVNEKGFVRDQEFMEVDTWVYDSSRTRSDAEYIIRSAFPVSDEIAQSIYDYSEKNQDSLLIGVATSTKSITKSPGDEGTIVGIFGPIERIDRESDHALILDASGKVIEEDGPVIADGGWAITVNGNRIQTTSGFVPAEDAFSVDVSDLNPGDRVEVRTLHKDGFYSLNCPTCSVKKK